MDLVDVIVHGIPAAWDGLWRLALTPSLTMSPLGLLAIVLLSRSIGDWIARHAWRVPCAVTAAWEWLVCKAVGHRDSGYWWCGRCGRRAKARES